MRTVINQLDQLVEFFLCVLMTVLVLNVSWQVITRFILTEPSSLTEEIARFLLMWIGLIGAAYAYRRGMHLGIDIISEKLEGRTKSLTKLFVYLLTLVVTIFVLIVGGTNLVFLTLELNQLSSALGLPMGLIYLCLPLSGFLIALYTLEMIFIECFNPKPAGDA